MVTFTAMMRQISTMIGDSIGDIRFVHDWLVRSGVPASTARYLNMLILALLLVVVSYLAYVVAQKLLQRMFHKLSERTETSFDDLLYNNKAIRNISKAIPYIIILQLFPLVFADFPGWLPFIKKLVDVYLVILIVQVVRSFLYTCRDFAKVSPHFKDKPVESFIQVVLIFLYVAAGLIIFSLLTGKSVLAFLTAMGAASAILLLVFKDTILGFVASIQVSVNDMVRIGDWISMEKYGADGDVVEINLASVKVQNWDMTITTIPTYFLISDSFKNWRGMQQSGGRRIKRSIFIKISSVRYLGDDDVERLKKIQLLRQYLEDNGKSIKEYNKANNVDESLLINGRHFTNIGVFRIYIDEFIKHHPDIHKGMIMMVRQLEPTVTGMAIEVYAFSNKTDWVIYERVMSDIFDHLLAAVKYFDLEAFEMPASDDVRYLKQDTTKQ